MSFSFKKPEDSPGFLLWRLTNQWQRMQRQALSKLGITHGQFVIMAGILWLSHNSAEEVSQNKVAQFIKIDKMSMSDLTAALLNKKLIERQQNESDKRAYTLKLTARGHELVKQAIPIVEGIDASFFQKEAKGLLHLLSKSKKLVTS